MTQIVGIRDGHRVITTVTGKAGAMHVDRRCHPQCPCRAPGLRSARIARRRKPTSH